MRKNRFAAFGGGAVIGTLGGLIGLGGAEFRLPLLIGVFGFASLEAVILNKAMSIVVVASVLLVFIAVLLVFGHNPSNPGIPPLAGASQVAAGVAAGFGIGLVASLLGVAGGELLIPTLVLLFGLDIKLAGSLSLAISLPTILTGFTRYSKDQSFAVVGRNRGFLLIMAAGSLFGAFLGGQLVGMVPVGLLLPLLALILVISAIKVWRQSSPVLLYPAFACDFF